LSKQIFKANLAEDEKILTGKHQEGIRAVSALLSDRHMFIEDVPGIGKTMLASAIARSVYMF